MRHRGAELPRAARTVAARQSGDETGVAIAEGLLRAGPLLRQRLVEYSYDRDFPSLPADWQRRARARYFLLTRNNASVVVKAGEDELAPDGRVISPFAGLDENALLEAGVAVRQLAPDEVDSVIAAEVAANRDRGEGQIVNGLYEVLDDYFDDRART